MNPVQYAEDVWRKGEPYLAPSAVAYLEEVITPSSKVFEWGAGGSTIWLAKRVAKVVSIEHQLDWYKKLRVRLANEHIDNVDLEFISLAFYPVYSQAILGYDFHFDLVLVDGRDRVECIRSAIPKVRPGGFLVLDNSDRPRYEPGIALLSDWERLDFTDQWMTSIFRKG